MIVGEGVVIVAVDGRMGGGNLRWISEEGRFVRKRFGVVRLVRVCCIVFGSGWF